MDSWRGYKPLRDLGVFAESIALNLLYGAVQHKVNKTYILYKT